MYKFLLVVLTMASLGSASWADVYIIPGQVYAVVPVGLYLQTSQGVTFIPSAGATFRVHGDQVRLDSLQPGAAIDAYCQSGYPLEFLPAEFVAANPGLTWVQYLAKWRSEQGQRAPWLYREGRWYSN